MAKRETTQQRATRNRELRRENLREQLKGKAYLNQIEKGYKELNTLQKAIRDSANTEKAPQHVSNTINKAEARHKIIKTMIDTNFRRLAKVLPDVKAIELSDGDGGSLTDAFAAAVTAANELQSK